MLSVYLIALELIESLETRFSIQLIGVSTHDRIF